MAVNLIDPDSGPVLVRICCATCSKGRHGSNLPVVAVVQARWSTPTPNGDTLECPALRYYFGKVTSERGKGFAIGASPLLTRGHPEVTLYCRRCGTLVVDLTTVFAAVKLATPDHPRVISAVRSGDRVES